jgi:HAMP domain-containing protein
VNTKTHIRTATAGTLVVLAIVLTGCGNAASLAALQPPNALQPVQDAVVKGVQAAQAGVEKLGANLQSGSAKASARKAQVQAEVDKYKSQVDGLAQQLKSALGSLTGP